MQENEVNKEVLFLKSKISEIENNIQLLKKQYSGFFYKLLTPVYKRIEDNEKVFRLNVELNAKKRYLHLYIKELSNENSKLKE
jgi:hypothetical protein